MDSSALNSSMATVTTKLNLQKNQPPVDKNFRIYYKNVRTMEDDEAAQIELIFQKFDFAKNKKVKTQYLPEILRLLQYNVGLEEEKELMAMLDKFNQGRFTFEKLRDLLCQYSFKEDSQESLLEALSELDDDADGYISRQDLDQTLKTLGEGLSQDELKQFYDLVCSSDDPASGAATNHHPKGSNMVSIQRVADILMPKQSLENQMIQGLVGEKSQAALESVTDPNQTAQSATIANSAQQIEDKS